jgi:hypothetical protein
MMAKVLALVPVGKVLARIDAYPVASGSGEGPEIHKAPKQPKRSGAIKLFCSVQILYG